MRLIDADALKKELYTMTEWNGDVHRVIYEISIDDAPTVEERPKGEWVADGFFYHNGFPFNYYRCTCCNEKFKQRFDYCPSCGADMKGEEE